MDLLPSLKEIETFKEVPDDQLLWLIENDEVLNIDEGDHLL